MQHKTFRIRHSGMVNMFDCKLAGLEEQQGNCKPEISQKTNACATKSYIPKLRSR